MLMKKLSEYLFLWTLGGILYYSFEMLFRGFSHWSMFLLGGLCFLFFWLQGHWVNWSDPMWIQVIRCTIFITACEFTTGIIEINGFNGRYGIIVTSHSNYSDKYVFRSR